MKKLFLSLVCAAFTLAAGAQQKWAYQADFNEGRACVKDASGKWGYIDESGKVISPCKWRSNYYYQEGMGRVINDDEKYGYLDLDGNEVIPCQFEFGGFFSEGLAADVNCTAKVPEELKISDVHLCAIVGNLLDNAIEACEKITEGASPRFIRIYIGLFKSQLYISVANSTCEKYRRRLSELVTAKLGEHGFGLRRIDKIAEKYDGYVNRKNEPGIFATEVMIPL